MTPQGRTRMLGVATALAVAALGATLAGCSSPATPAAPPPAAPATTAQAAPPPPPATTANKPAPAQTAAAPKTTAAPASTFGVGTQYKGTCSVAWPSAPIVTSTTLQMTMQCSGIPSEYMLVWVIYEDPTLNVTPSTGNMTVTGEVVDFAKSQAGLTMPVIHASKITIP